SVYTAWKNLKERVSGWLLCNVLFIDMVEKYVQRVQLIRVQLSTLPLDIIIVNKPEVIMKPILLVEDNPNDRLLMERAFKKSTLTNEMVVVNDGEQALEFLFGNENTEPQPLPLLVLLDLKLPKVDGLEVLRQIRSNERTELLPVVILTS